jgi:Protein of unknown function (DUF4058)
MNTPFPGMDPYLEHPALWPGLHNRLIITIANQLQPHLLPRYIASIEQRVFVEGPNREAIPDVLLRKLRPSTEATTATLPSAGSPILLIAEPVEVHEAYIEILDRYAGMKVVTLIELVSPSNKKRGMGRRLYRAKQGEALAGRRNLIEIDLLRRGRHVLSVPRWLAEDLGPYDYLACVNRFPDRHKFESYPCQLRQRLPQINVPLEAPDADVTLDIQAALEQAYQDASYALLLRYNEPCKPPLDVADQQWANERLAAYRAAHPELFPPPPAS